MAVSAPSDDPGYVYGSPPPPNAVDPGMWARLMGYTSGLNPIGSANAAEMPAPGPTIDSARQRAIADAQAQLNAGNASNNIRPPTLGPTPPIISAGQIPTTLSAPAGPTPIAPSYRPEDDPRFTAPNPYGAGMPRGTPPPVVGNQPSINAPLPPPRPAGLGATIDPRMRGEVPAAQSPWITSAFDRPNQNPGLGGGMMGGALAGGRGGGGPAQMGMLDLSGIFRGGQPAAVAAAPAQPRTKINVGKIPANARAEVPPVSPGPTDPSIIARQRMKRPKASSSSQGGGYSTVSGLTK